MKITSKSLSLYSFKKDKKNSRAFANKHPEAAMRDFENMNGTPAMPPVQVSKFKTDADLKEKTKTIQDNENQQEPRKKSPVKVISPSLFWSTNVLSSDENFHQKKQVNKEKTARNNKSSGNGSKLISMLFFLFIILFSSILYT